MATSHDIKLPIGVAPRFPDLCICCLAPSPGATMRYTTNAIGWWTVVFTTFGKRHACLVPVCPACRATERRNRWVRFTVEMLFLGVGCVVAISLLKSYHGVFKYHLTVATAMVALLPIIVWRVMRPPPFDMTAFSESIDYEFRSAVYAVAFMHLNMESAD